MGAEEKRRIAEAQEKARITELTRGKSAEEAAAIRKAELARFAKEEADAKAKELANASADQKAELKRKAKAAAAEKDRLKRLAGRKNIKKKLGRTTSNSSEAGTFQASYNFSGIDSSDICAKGRKCYGWNLRG